MHPHDTTTAPAGFTPGPWKAECVTTGSQFNWLIRAAVPLRTYADSRVRGGTADDYDVAKIEGLDFNVDEPFRYAIEEQQEANAKLIASAPKLHADREALVRALEAVLSEVQFNEPRCLGEHYLHGVHGGSCDGARVAFAQARAALRQARGES